MDKQTEFAIAQGKHIANAINLIQGSVQRAMQRKPEPLDIECDLCGESGEQITKDGVSICEECQREEVA